jgi:hypothetical protein
MIQQLQGHITEAQINTISRMICTQYRDYLRLTGSLEFNRIFANEYAPHNRQHSISWAISSAFQSNTVIGNNLQISCLVYGCGHSRPLLSNDAIELMVLNRTTHFNAEYLRRRYQYNLNQFSNEKLFAYIRFSVENRQLVDIRLCLPDVDGNIIAEEILFNKQEILRFVA